jgi:hypothetical protein
LDSCLAYDKTFFATVLLRPPEPKFHYTDINTSNLNGIVPHIVIDSRLNLMKEQPEFSQFIKLAIEKSIQVTILSDSRQSEWRDMRKC